MNYLDLRVQKCQATRNVGEHKDALVGSERCMCNITHAARQAVLQTTALHQRVDQTRHSTIRAAAQQLHDVGVLYLRQHLHFCLHLI